jgi:MFS family permease
VTLVSFAPFRHHDYARLWTGAFVSNIGTWMQMVAVAAYVTDVTGKAAWTGLVAAADFVPIALLAPLGGALADRAPRRVLLLTTTLVQVGFSAALTVLFIIGDPAPALLTLCVFGGGVAAALGFPAYQAMLPDLVPEEDLPGAISLSSAQYNLGRIVGPALAGLVIAAGGYAWALGVNAASFFAVVAVLLTLTLPPPPPRNADVTIRAAIAEGARFVRGDRGLRLAFSAMCVNTLLAAPFIALVPAMAQNVFDAGARGTSVLITAQGIGAVLMAFMLNSFVQRSGTGRVVATLLTLLPFALIVYAFMPQLWASAIALLVVGFLYLGTLSSFFTISQLRAPAALRGRVLSVNNLVLGSLYPLGALVQGRLADSIGLRTTTAVTAAIMAVVVITARVARPAWTRVIDEASAIEPAGPPAVGELAG